MRCRKAPSRQDHPHSIEQLLENTVGLPECLGHGRSGLGQWKRKRDWIVWGQKARSSGSEDASRQIVYRLVLATKTNQAKYRYSSTVKAGIPMNVRSTLDLPPLVKSIVFSFLAISIES